MKIFIPAVKDTNPFFDEIIAHSKTRYYFGNVGDKAIGFDAVLIHWPEQIFSWKEPSEEQLQFLENQLKFWRMRMKIVYVMHNEKRHLGMNDNFDRLYNLILDNTDFIVHLGRYSHKKYSQRYPKVLHIYIPHPLYKNHFTHYPKIEARKKLIISQKKKIIIVPGNIRSIEERQMIIEAFKPFRNSNTLLLVPNMFKKVVNINFKGRYLLKKIIDVKGILEYLYNEEYQKCFSFKYEFMDFDKLSLMLSASDVVLIPRIDSLNSGNVFLGLTFKKIVVGPAIGNIKEFLEMFSFPTFEPKNLSSVRKSLQAAMSIADNNISFNDRKLREFEPKRIANQWDDFLENIHEM